MSAYDELVKRLRDKQVAHLPGGYQLCAQAADAIEELSKTRWIPVTERLPEPMKYVLLMVRRTAKAFNNRPFISTGYVSMNKVSWWCSHDGDCSDNGVEVTHWMPLPSCPETPKEETE